MTKKHFDALAAALLSARKGSHTAEQSKADAVAVARVCALFNPKFDRERFLAACGTDHA